MALVVRRLLFWDACALTYDSLTAFEPYRRALEQVARVLPPASVSTPVLDAGTGTGNLALLLGRKGLKVIGVDCSTAMLARAEQKRRRAGAHSIRYLRADLNGPLPFPDGAFDYVVSAHTLHVLRSRSATLRELRRVLKDGGTLALSELVRPVGVARGVREGLRREGWLRTAATCARLAPLLPFLVPLNVGLRRRESSPEGLARELTSAGFAVEVLAPGHMAGSAWLVVGRKEAARAVEHTEDRVALRR